MGFSWRKTFKTKQTRKPKCLSAFDVEHAQCLTGYHVFMVSGLDLARAPRRARLTARKKGSGYENGANFVNKSILHAHSRTQSPSYARSTDGDEGLWPNPYQTGI